MLVANISIISGHMVILSICTMFTLNIGVIPLSGQRPRKPRRGPTANSGTLQAAVGPRKPQWDPASVKCPVTRVIFELDNMIFVRV